MPRSFESGAGLLQTCLAQAQAFLTFFFCWGRGGGARNKGTYSVGMIFPCSLLANSKHTCRVCQI